MNKIDERHYPANLAMLSWRSLDDRPNEEFAFPLILLVVVNVEDDDWFITTGAYDPVEDEYCMSLPEEEGEPADWKPVCWMPQPEMPLGNL